MSHPSDDPIVDRVLELDLLGDHLHQVATGGVGHAVLLLGESGVGKSRLVTELLSGLDQHRLTLVYGRCLGTGAEPLLPVKSALAELLGRTPARIRRSLKQAAPRLLDAVPFLGAFLGKAGESLMAERVFRNASLEGIYEELSRLLLGIADKRGLCLVVEDLHLADQDTLFFLSYFLRKIRSRRVLVLLTAQSEHLRDVPHLTDLVTQWTVEGYVVRTVLPLERAHVGEYVRTRAAIGGEVDESLVDRLFGLTAGNPFYLKETLKLMAGPGAVQGQPVPEEIVVPPKVEAVLRQRLDRATGATRRLLEAAAVVLETTDQLEPIAYVMEVPTGDAVRAFSDACELGLMREGPAGEISFVHSLMQRTVYADLGTNLRRYLQERAARWCEQDGRLVSAAFHYEQAGQTADLVRTALAAAAHAEQRGAYHSALPLYQKVRPYLSIEEIGPLLGGAMITLGEWDQAQEVVDQLPATDARVRLLRSRLRFVSGDFARARAEALAALHSSQADRGVILVRLADIALYLGDFAEARRYARQALEDGAEGAARDAAQVPFLTILGVTAYHAGDLDEGERRYTAALELVRRVPEEERDVVTETMLMGNLGNIALVRGDLATAERWHASALRMRREVADARGALHSMHALGRTRLASGDREGALRLFDETDQLAESLGETLERAKLTQTRAELHLRDGLPDPAYQLAARALRAFEQSGTRYDITHAQLALSAASLACGREREAVKLGAAARAAIARHGYGLLRRFYPQIGYALTERVAGGLTAYACGDAVGLPYENLPPSDVSIEEIEALRPRGSWSAGETSDDTALTLLVARWLIEQTGGGHRGRTVPRRAGGPGAAGQGGRPVDHRGDRTLPRHRPAAHRHRRRHQRRCHAGNADWLGGPDHRTRPPAAADR
jgi:tetratricopeptide (TPR) repeat protein